MSNWLRRSCSFHSVGSIEGAAEPEGRPSCKMQLTEGRIQGHYPDLWESDEPNKASVYPSSGFIKISSIDSIANKIVESLKEGKLFTIVWMTLKLQNSLDCLCIAKKTKTLSQKLVLSYWKWGKCVRIFLTTPPRKYITSIVFSRKKCILFRIIFWFLYWRRND